MKRIEYYCGKDFDARIGQTRPAVQWLYAKIFSAEETINELNKIDFMQRDFARINDIISAIKDWRQQIKEIYGIDEDM